jgi:hypothetical protein
MGCVRKPDRRALIGGAIAAGAELSFGAAHAQTATRVVEEQLHGRRAFVVQNGRMRLGVLPGGGFIGEARLVSPDPKKNVNVMRVPHYQTIDPFTYDMARHASLYGDGVQRRLMSGYMGHFTCFPHFAASSDAELAQDYGQHGELIMVEWRRQGASDDADLVLTAELPMTHFSFERRVRMPADESVAYITETAENLLRFDRPASWTQHGAFGPPFMAVNSARAEASARNVVLGRGEQARLTEFPLMTADDGVQRDVRPFVGITSLWMMDRTATHNYYLLYNTELKVLVGYVFDGAHHPWLLDYQENMRMTTIPWDGRVVMRGPCFGDSVTGGLRRAVTMGSMLGTPTHGWFEARAVQSRRYAIFMAEVPESFRGVERLEVSGGRLRIWERETRHLINIKASLL